MADTQGAPRTRRAAKRLTVIIAVATGLLLVAAVVFAALAPSLASALAVVLGLLVCPLSVALGVAITKHTSGNVVGVYLGLVGFTVAAVVAKEAGLQVLAASPALAQSLAWLVALTAENVGFVFAAIALLVLYFPSGHVPSPRWRFVPWAIAGCSVVSVGYGAVEPAPFRPPLGALARPFPAPPGWVETVGAVALFALLALALASVLSLIGRYRTAGLVERRQIRWIALGGLCVVLYPVLCLVEIAIWGEPLWLSAATGLGGLVAIPTMTGIAMLRHELYDVDRVLVSAITWTLLTAALLAVYAGATVAAGVLIGRESALIAAATTALAAVALSPVRKRVQARVDRRLYPLRRSAFDALDDLTARIGAGQAQPEELELVLQQALRDPGLRVGYGEAATGVPISLGETQIGAVVPTDVGVAASDLLRQVAQRAAPTVAMAVMRQDLADAVREVEASRARLVQIGFEERRRLERDLHDGAQQRLVALGMDLRVTQRHLHDVGLRSQLDAWVAELATAVAELRQVAHGIRPSSLDDGLEPAIARLVRGIPLPVEIAIEDAVLPDDMATTVYFVASEALTNAVKHADASRISLSVSQDSGRVRVRVHDDGCGGARVARDSTLADRVSAMGGTLRVLSPLGHGTLVEAELPCAS